MLLMMERKEWRYEWEKTPEELVGRRGCIVSE